MFSCVYFVGKRVHRIQPISEEARNTQVVKNHCSSVLLQIVLALPKELLSKALLWENSAFV